MFPQEEKQLGDTIFWEKKSMNIFDYLNLMFYGGGAVFFLYYFTSSFDSMGYILFIFVFIFFCEIMGG